MIDLPKTAAPAPALTGWTRTRAWLDSAFIDHGMLRAIYANIRRVDDALSRAAQPSARHLAWAKRAGFKTVLNLRGERPTCGSYQLEREACRDLGLTLVDFPIRSRSAVEKETALAAIDLWDRLDYPVFMHCKSGADRTGFMATLYLHAKRGEPLEAAMRHLSLAYGHIRQAKTGVLDHFFESYLATGAARGLSLREWVEQDYDRATLDAGFKENWAAGILVNKILRRE